MLILQNIVFIPAVISIAVSGIKLYKSIIANRNRENIKIEILRHTLFSGIAILFLVFSSAIEVFISTNLFKFFSKYF